MRVFAISIFILSAIFILAKCSNQPKVTYPLTGVMEQEYMEKGNEIVKAAFSGLSSRLQAALQEGGVPHAIDYCNIIALPVTDSLSSVYNAKIKRSSNRLRNPENTPVNWEEEVLAEFQEKLNSAEEVKPIVRQLAENKIGYAAPIVMLPQCLQCHGNVETDVKEYDYELIKKLYPKDRAVGFGNGDLRGIWSITFTPKN